MQKPKLSDPSKMPGYSWDLQAVETCPGHKYRTGPQRGEVKPSCQICYAKKGNYRFKAPRMVREFNRKDWQRSDWVASMAAALAFEDYFRWFSSGDIYCEGLARKIYEVCKATPEVRHWIPTQSHDIPKIRPWLDKINALPNAVVRASSGSISGETLPEEELPQSTIIATTAGETGAAHLCPAPQQGGKCGRCRACWSKDVRIVAYTAH